VKDKANTTEQRCLELNGQLRCQLDAAGVAQNNLKDLRRVEALRGEIDYEID
jgi:hypothetical protein